MPIHVEQVFRDTEDPLTQIEWEKRTACIEGSGFIQEGVEFPKSWSQRATNIVASKYFYGQGGDREYSLAQVIHRVVNAISGYGLRNGYFGGRIESEDEFAEYATQNLDADVKARSVIFEDELAAILVGQYASFNSPVWFNIGVPGVRQQGSACFINSVEDNMESILALGVAEGQIFKRGSGAGVNLSALRAEGEPLSGGGTSSGPISFMRGLDAQAGIIKSGGVTRRAAKMVLMDIDHPDVMKFIQCKQLEEKKARALIAAGYDGSIDGEAYGSVFFQNANHSVRLTDGFMRQALMHGDGDASWEARRRTDGEYTELPPAREILDEIAKTAWACGDPGVQFTDTINNMHTCAQDGAINASNPCSEFVFLDDTSCNLASINLLKFWDGEVFDWFKLRQVVEILIMAQDILVGLGEYPTDAIDKMTRATRPLGLGIANLGALLMTMGIAYDSDNGRQLAAAIMAFITGTAYGASAGLAEELGAFEQYERNKLHMGKVIGRHAEAADKLMHDISLAHRGDSWTAFWGKVTDEVEGAWGRAIQFGESCGYRNAQVTVIAPTGTISFMMDCDTTGIEPLLAPKYRKALVGGGTMEVVPECYDDGLNKIRVTNMLNTIDHSLGEAMPQHPVLATALGDNTLSPEAHLKMVAAVQPFLSGAVSKTINMPAESTVRDVRDIIVQAWQDGVKCVAIYRDGSKGSQPMTVEKVTPTTSIREVAEYAASLEGPPLPNPLRKLVRDADAETMVQLVAGDPETIATMKVTSAKMLQRIAADPKVIAAVSDLQQFKSEREIGEMLSENIADKIAREPYRRKLDKTRDAKTHKFDIGGHEGYLTVGAYKNGKVAEVFVSMAKEGTTISGLLGQWAMTFSIALQYGVPLDLLIDKHSYVRYEPSGFTSDPDVRQAHSITDYIVRWIKANMTGDSGKAPGPPSPPPPSSEKSSSKNSHASTDGNVCQYCGGNLTRQGTCYVCTTCGESTGCG